MSDTFQISAILSEWSVEHVKGEGTKTTWGSAGLEGMWAITNPVKDPLGIALVGETRVGSDSVAVEGRLILQKNFGPLVAAYNAIVESEWAGPGHSEKTGTVEQTLGVSYQFTPSFMFGVEAVDELVYENWSSAGPHALYVGPSLSYRKGNVWTALAPVFRVSSAAGEPDFQVRLVVGINF